MFYAAWFNFLIAAASVGLGLIEILRSTQPDFSSRFYHFSSSVRCYAIIGCPVKIAYGIFLFEWLILAAVLYRMSLQRMPAMSDRRKLMLGFLVAFPITSYLMAQLMLIILFVADVLKFGFV